MQSAEYGNCNLQLATSNALLATHSTRSTFFLFSFSILAERDLRRSKSRIYGQHAAAAAGAAVAASVGHHQELPQKCIEPAAAAAARQRNAAPDFAISVSSQVLFIKNQSTPKSPNAP